MRALHLTSEPLRGGEPKVVSARMLEDRANDARGSQVSRMLLSLMQASAIAEHCTRDRLPHPLETPNL